MENGQKRVENRFLADLSLLLVGVRFADGLGSGGFLAGGDVVEVFDEAFLHFLARHDGVNLAGSI